MRLQGVSCRGCRSIFAQSRLDRFGFDVEVLRLARRFNYRIVEVPVVCTYRCDSSVRRVWDAASMFLDILGVRCVQGRPVVTMTSDDATGLLQRAAKVLLAMRT